MDRIVADASVVAKLFVEEEFSDEARMIRNSSISGEAALIEPPILAYEVINGLRYSKIKGFTSEELKLVSEALSNFNFSTQSTSQAAWNEAIDSAIKYGLSIYDAIYVATAKLSGATLYTADDVLLKKTRLPFVKHISSYR